MSDQHHRPSMFNRAPVTQQTAKNINIYATPEHAAAAAAKERADEQWQAAHRTGYRMGLAEGRWSGFWKGLIIGFCIGLGTMLFIISK